MVSHHSPSLSPSCSGETLQGVKDVPSASATSIPKATKRLRTTFRSSQLRILEYAFYTCPYPDSYRREQIARATGIDEAKIQVRIRSSLHVCVYAHAYYDAFPYVGMVPEQACTVPQASASGAAETPCCSTPWTCTTTQPKPLSHAKRPATSPTDVLLLLPPTVCVQPPSLSFPPSPPLPPVHQHRGSHLHRAYHPRGPPPRSSQV